MNSKGSPVHPFYQDGGHNARHPGLGVWLKQRRMWGSSGFHQQHSPAPGNRKGFRQVLIFRTKIFPYNVTPWQKSVQLFCPFSIFLWSPSPWIFSFPLYLSCIPGAYLCLVTSILALSLHFSSLFMFFSSPYTLFSFFLLFLSWPSDLFSHCFYLLSVLFTIVHLCYSRLTPFPPFLLLLFFPFHLSTTFTALSSLPHSFLIFLFSFLVSERFWLLLAGHSGC